MNLQNVGGIQYTVEANTEKLIKAEQETQRSVKKMEDSLKSVGKSSAEVDKVSKSVKDLGSNASSTGNALSTMQKTLLGLATVTTAATLGKMADDYRAMKERVKGATESLEEFDHVQQRLLKSANETFRPLAEAQELFISTSANLRDYGYALDEALDITDSMSFGFVRNATSADKASTAIRNYDAVLSTGRVNANQWLAISGAIDTLAQDMAESMGKTAREIDELGFSGQLTAAQLNEGLLQAFKKNRDGANAMTNTIEDATVALKNNLSAYVGELNETLGATNLVANAIIFVSENIKTLATIMLSVGAGAAAKYAIQFGMVTVAKMKDALATRASIAEELKLAQANLAAAQAEVARTAALIKKGASHTANVKAIEAERLATARLTTAQTAANAASRSFLSLLGGPAGIVGLLAVGVTSMAMFAKSTSDTKLEITELNKPLDELINKLKEMNKAQREAAMRTFEKEQIQAVKNVEEAYNDLFNTISEYAPRQKTLLGTGNIIQSEFNKLIDGLKEAKEQGQDLLPLLERLSDEWGIPKEALDDLITQNGNLADLIKTADNARTKLSALTDAQRELASATSEASAEIRRQAEINAEASKSLATSLENVTRQFKSMQDGGSAVKRLEREIAELEATGAQWNETQREEIDLALQRAQAIDKEQKLRKTSNKTINESNRVLKDLQQELYLATLSGKELAIARAEQRLGEFATTQEVQAVRELAGALYDLNKAKEFGETDEEVRKTIIGDVQPLSGGLFDEQVSRYEAEAEKEQKRYQDQLERLRQARELKLQTEDEFNRLEFEMREKHEQRMTQITQAENNARLGIYASALGSIVDVLKNAENEQSGIYKAMFAVSKGFAIAEATINAYNAISKAWASAPFPANLAAVASTTPQVMGLVNALSGVSYGGGRQYGGNVSPDRFYQVNETGQPEMLEMNGKQFLLPNKQGKVIPADKMIPQGASTNVKNVTISQVFHIESDANIDEQMIEKLRYEMRKETMQMSKNISLETIGDQKRNGGMLRG